MSRVRDVEEVDGAEAVDWPHKKHEQILDATREQIDQNMIL